MLIKIKLTNLSIIDNVYSYQLSDSFLSWVYDNLKHPVELERVFVFKPNALPFAGVYYSKEYYLIFDNEKDALLFKMVWL